MHFGLYQLDHDSLYCIFRESLAAGNSFHHYYLKYGALVAEFCRSASQCSVWVQVNICFQAQGECNLARSPRHCNHGPV